MSRLEYMLCVMPAAEIDLIPETYRGMMTHPRSVYLNMYRDTR